MQSTGQCVEFEAIGKAALRPCEIFSPQAGEVLVASEYTALVASPEAEFITGANDTIDGIYASSLTRRAVAFPLSDRSHPRRACENPTI